MSNYTKTTNFAAKDSLPSGNAAKIVKGAEIDTEFNNIATASATKANANNAALTGTTVFETLSDGTIGVTGWVDEDNMSSDSAVLIPTQQSVKAYVDSQVTAQDLDVTDGTTSIDIDLDSESLGILGGTGIDSTASGTGVTLAIDSTVTTLTGTQTLSNKTLTTPVISGALTTNSTIDGRDVATDGTKLDGIESGATADQTAAQIKTAYESNADTNAFTDADESKLDGIEASADVTDTTNVTAAGALMDSELTSIASVKAMNQGVATTDSPTFAGVTAPITGNVTGNLTGNVTGNVTGDLTGDVTGNVAGNLTGSVLTAAQTNITSVGTLGALTVTGDVTVDTNTLKVDSTNNRVGILNASPDVTLDIGTATDAVHMPVGTTAQRPTGAAGYFRYNSSLEQFEGYTSEWGSIGGGGGTNTFTADSFTGNGSTTAYALSQVTSSEDNLLVFIEGVFQQQDAYSIATSGGTTTLTFSAAPANGNDILIYSVAAAVSGSNLNIDSMTGDGSDTTLTLSISPVNENNTQVFIDGVYQSKSNYSISGTTLTFSTAPPTGTAVEVMTFTQTDINVPVDGTITSAKLSGALTTPSDLTVTGTSQITRLGLGVAAHASAALQITTTDQHIRLNNGSELGVIDLDSDGKLNIWAHGDGETINLKTGSGSGTDVLSVVGTNVGIGSVPDGWSGITSLDVAQSASFAGHASSNAAYFMNNLYFNGSAWTAKNTGTSSGIVLDNITGHIAFYQNASASADTGVTLQERIRIDSSGDTFFGINSKSDAPSNGAVYIAGDNSVGSTNSYAQMFVVHNSSTNHGIIIKELSSSGQALQTLNSSGTVVGGISTTNTATSFNTSSDYRLKENVVAMSGATERLKQLNPSRFNFIADADTTVDGFLAHEVQAVVPEAISGTKDAMMDEEYEVTPAVLDDDGNVTTEAVMGTRSVPNYQGIDQSKLVPLLVATIQELEARLTALENT